MMQESGSSGIAQSEGSVQGPIQQVNVGNMNMIVNRVIVPEITMPLEHQLVMAKPAVTFGAVLPPDFIWTNSAKIILPAVLAASIPRSVLGPNFCYLNKRTWDSAFDLHVTFESKCQPQVREKSCMHIVKRRPVARTLAFETVQEDDAEVLPPIFSATPFSAAAKKRRARKITTTDQDLSVRRSTRRSTQTNGFRHTSLPYTPIKKKPRSSWKIDQEKDQDAVRQDNKAGKMKNSEPETITTPHTPIRILQQMGRALQIPEEELTVDKLAAGPEEEATTDSSDV